MAISQWVPDWRQTVPIQYLDTGIEYAEHSLPLYDPCPGTMAEIRIIDQELELRGVLLEPLVVKKVTAIWDDPEGSTKCPFSWQHEMLDTRPGLNSNNMEISIRRSLVSDRSGVDYDTFMEGSASKPGWKRGGILDWNVIASRPATQPFFFNRRAMVANLTKTCYGRRMGKLRDDSIAILPAAARIGDQVVLFFGGKFLYVIRPTKRPGAYEFIGECYVDGMMDGALMNESNKEGVLLRLV